MTKVKYFLPAAAWIVTITLLSLISTKNLTKFSVEIIGIDKLIHIFIYLILSFLLAWGLKKTVKYKKLSLKMLAAVFLFTSLYGLSMEIAQKLMTTGRNFEYYDIIANIIGSLIGVLFFIRKK